MQRQGRKDTVVFRNTNRFSPSRCKLPNNVYHNSHCKALNHSTPPIPEAHKFPPSSAHNKGLFSPANSPSSATRARQPGNSTHLLDVSVNALDYVKTLVTESVACLRTKITTSILNEVENTFQCHLPHPFPWALLRTIIYSACQP